MKIVFWNLYKNENSKHIRNLLLENDIDIAIFAEYKGLNLSKLKKDNPEYHVADNIDGCNRLLFVYKNGIKYTIRQEQYYYAIHSFIVNNNHYIIVGLHLPSNMHSKADDRKEEISYIIDDVKNEEKKQKTSKTLIIGDFNANPFDSELILKNMFNAVLYKEIIRKQEVVTHKRRKYKRFYNPMINYITEVNQHYGTYYYANGIDALNWNCYDQVLVRKELIDNLSDVRFCKSIDKCNLITKNGMPNKRISDHLPLIIEVSV